MITALATRGYLCPGGTIQVIVGEGPKITDVKETKPGIIGAAAAVVAGPTISGSVAPGPNISGGSTAGSTGVEPPYISGSDKPKIG